MNIKKYFWGLNEKALKKTEYIIRNPHHQKFIERIFILLSRCDNPRELFSVVSKKQFLEKWPEIRRYWLKRKQSDDFRTWWETVYERLLEKQNSEKSLRGEEPEIFVKIGKIIRDKRINKGLSQLDFARKTGIKQPDVSAIESGKKNITLETLMRLCKILDIKNIPVR